MFYLLAISSIRREIDEKCALLGCYLVSGGNSVSTFRDNLSVPPSRVKNLDSLPLKMGPVGCPETLALNYHCLLRNNPEESSSRNTFSLIHI